jgi:hypothetical protein
MNLFGSLFKNVTVTSVTTLMAECIRKPKKLQNLAETLKSHELVVIQAVTLVDDNDLEKLRNYSLDYNQADLSKLFNSEFKRRKVVKTQEELSHTSNLIQNQLSIQEQQLRDLQEILISNFRHTKSYLESDQQRNFVDIVYAEFVYNGLIFPEHFKVPIAEALTSGQTVSTVITDYSCTMPLTNIQACLVTAILNKKFHPHNVPDFDETHPQYIKAFSQSREIISMTDFDILTALIA